MCESRLFLLSAAHDSDPAYLCTCPGLMLPNGASVGGDTQPGQVGVSAVCVSTFCDATTMTQ